MTQKEINRMNEEELAGVSGGVKIRAAAVTGTTNSQDKGEAFERHFCIKCNEDRQFRVFSGGRPVCMVCGAPFNFGGN